MALPKEIFIFVSLCLACTAALSCYKCRDLTEVEVSFPNYPAIAGLIKAALLYNHSDPACQNRNYNSGLNNITCQPNAQRPPKCYSADVRLRLQYKHTKGTVTVGCRARLRGCVKTQLDVGCPLDVSQFQELIDEINKIASDGENVENDKITGNVCVCDDTDACNDKLPDKEPDPISAAQRLVLLPTLLMLPVLWAMFT